jgi:thermitase
MKKNYLISGLMIFSTAAFATPFNGYIVKLKNNQLTSSVKSLSSYGVVSTIAKTQFGTFAKIETKKGLTDQGFKNLAQNPNIEYIEPNYIISLNADTTPKDQSFKKQWGLKNGTAGNDINALKAWTVTDGSKDVKIAVIDTGVDYKHTELKNQIDINEKELNGKAGVDDDGNGFVDDIYGYDFANKDADPMDGHGHGTHCAGVIGAEHNTTGIAGVMTNVKIVPIKFLSDSGSGEEIDYAIKRGVKIMSNSWGGGEDNQSLKDAIAAANSAGIVFVAAAGNEYSDNDSTPAYPASYDVDNVISVGAFTSSGSKASYSNYGTKSVHVFAPGSNIYSTVPNNKYESMSGTSMATPHVAGIIGLLLSKEPNLTPKEIRERLIKTSNQTASLKGLSVSNGRVDAYRAIMNQ